MVIWVGFIVVGGNKRQYEDLKPFKPRKEPRDGAGEKEQDVGKGKQEVPIPPTVEEDREEV
jgi:hypothetical protein